MKKVKISVLTSLYNCSKYLPGYFAAVDQIVNKDDCEFLLLHNDPSNEELNIINKCIKENTCFRHIIIPNRENLYATWNRGIKLSNADYITVWNVDDIRFSESILIQAEALKATPETAIAYGDFYGSSIYGCRGTKLYQSPEWEGNEKEFYRTYLMSCFQMWRKSIHEKIGYYDEQFKCAGDLDFQIRVALHYPFVKVKQPLGIFLENQPQQISSSRFQQIENNIVFLRYGVFERINLIALPPALRLYNKNILLFFGQPYLFADSSPFTFAYKFKGLIISFLNIPLHIAIRLKKLKYNYKT